MLSKISHFKKYCQAADGNQFEQTLRSRAAAAQGPAVDWERKQQPVKISEL